MPFEHCHWDRRFSRRFLKSSKHQWEWGCERWAGERGPSKGCKAEGDAKSGPATLATEVCAADSCRDLSKIWQCKELPQLLCLETCFSDVLPSQKLSVWWRDSCLTSKEGDLCLLNTSLSPGLSLGATFGWKPIFSLLFPPPLSFLKSFEQMAKDKKALL